MRHLVLYSTLGCHLCEQARALSEPILAEVGCELRETDIADDDALMEAYGLRIPVLRDSLSDTELGWPFDSVELIRWLNNINP
jgi:hypothetical protein